MTRVVYLKPKDLKKREIILKRKDDLFTIIAVQDNKIDF